MTKDNPYSESWQNDLGLIGKSEAFERTLETIRQVAPTAITVLIMGESGTGKEMIARAIHTLSQRKEQPLLTVNCGAIPEGILESELFGHEKGSFTGAVETRKGYFELAEKGTLFLDEIGEMPLGTQVKLLRVLEEREFMRVGGSKVLKADVRVLAATNKDLEIAVKRNEFRKDLFYRLNAVKIEVPPLRQRGEDIRPLAIHFADTVCKTNDIPCQGFSEDGFSAIEQMAWPGNIRELRNIIERIIVLEKGRLIDRALVAKHLGTPAEVDRSLPMVVHKTTDQAERELIYRVLLDIRLLVEEMHQALLGGTNPNMAKSPVTQPFHVEVPPQAQNQVEEELTLREMEKKQIEKLLDRFRGNRRKTAKTLGIGERTLYRKLKEYGLE